MKTIENCFVEEIEQNKLMIKKHKNVCTILTYIGQFLTLAFVVTACILISVSASSIGIPIGITSFEIR